METFKFIVISIIAMACVGILGYWAVMTIEPGDVHVYKQQVEELKTTNAELEKEVADLKSQLADGTTPAPAATPTPTPTPTPTKTTTTPKPTATPTTTLKYQSLINDLQKLVDGKVYLKVGSQGIAVGTVQTFLNIYNKTSKRIDNDFGASLKADVIAFQKSVGVTASGQTGPTTFQKMIDWLKKQ